MYRIGFGYDVHRLVPDRRLIVGGVGLPYALGLDGHSDADVLTHAVMDAVLGALALGDIGRHFPDTDPAYRDADSIGLLRIVALRMREAGFVIGNLDATVVAQEPRMSPHIPAMRLNLAEALQTDIANVNVKATTTEGLGFEGEKRGISASCTVLLRAAERSLP